ncbi:MAG: cyclase family protein [Spirochaetales bacterium]|nr:cyclase family protein [Spirochaetales bacterium]
MIVDLSVPVGENSGEPLPPVIKRIDHRKGAKLLGWGRAFAYRKRFFPFLRELIKTFFSRRLGPADFPDGAALSDERITLSTHTGTHVDAPAHFGPLCEGRESPTIDQVPLEWCIGPGVVLRLTEVEPGGEILVSHIKEELERISHRLKPGDVVLLHTGADRKLGTPAYFTEFPGMSRDAVAYLLERGVKMIGTDAFGFDRPFGAMIRDYAQTGESSQLWPAHMYGREAEYIHIERLGNLASLPAQTGFTFAAFPVKIEKAGAGWTRAVAIFDE